MILADPPSTTASPKRVAVLGATGSVGRSTLEVIAGSEGRLKAFALSAHKNLSKLSQAASEQTPKFLVATDAQASKAHRWTNLPKGVEVLTGQEGLETVVKSNDVDIVLAAIVGAAGLRSTWAALTAGKPVALANKETLVMAGPLVGPLLEKTGGKLLPVDSEHSAIFQALEGNRKSAVKKIILTASGGAFRDWNPADLGQVTVEDALAHPTWDMGNKITIDSATMMNKALEIIEARWLFDLPVEKIDVVMHPQSIVHSLVEYVDGSVMSQMSPPDMKLPIQYALEYPLRAPGVAQRVDWSQSMHLDFYPPDQDRFPALKLGFDCARAGGSSGAVLNAANEAAVQSFLDGTLHFTEIVPACRSVLESHNFEAKPSLDDLIRFDKWARQEIQTWVYV